MTPALPFNLPQLQRAHPGLRPVLLGLGVNQPDVGTPGAQFLAAESHPELVAAYLAANRAAFPGALELPGWVLVDCFLAPGAVALWLDGEEIVSTWCGLPTARAGTVMGVSLFARRRGGGLGFAAKALGLAALNATHHRGLTQWDSPALRVHTRFGPLSVLGPAPAVHGAAERSFLYEGALSSAPRPVAERILPAEAAARARAGEPLTLTAPGLDEAGRVCLAR